MPRLRIVLLASGNGSLAQAIFDAELELEILCVISDKESQVLERAKSAGVPGKYLPMVGERMAWNKALFDFVTGLQPDLVVSVGFMRILDYKFVEAFPTINTHPSLLPIFPGAHAVQDAIAAGAQITGATVHWVDAGVDTGKIIRQVEVPVIEGDDVASLHERIKIVERRLIVETLAKFVATGIDGKN